MPGKCRGGGLLSPVWHSALRAGVVAAAGVPKPRSLCCNECTDCTHAAGKSHGMCRRVCTCWTTAGNVVLCSAAAAPPELHAELHLLSHYWPQRSDGHLEEEFLQERPQQWEADCEEQWQHSHIQHAAACHPGPWYAMVGLLRVGRSTAMWQSWSCVLLISVHAVRHQSLAQARCVGSCMGRRDRIRAAAHVRLPPSMAGCCTGAMGQPSSTGSLRVLVPCRSSTTTDGGVPTVDAGTRWLPQRIRQRPNE